MACVQRTAAITLRVNSLWATSRDWLDSPPGAWARGALRASSRLGLAAKGEGP